MSIDTAAVATHSPALAVAPPLPDPELTHIAARIAVALDLTHANGLRLLGAICQRASNLDVDKPLRQRLILSALASRRLAVALDQAPQP